MIIIYIMSSIDINQKIMTIKRDIEFLYILIYTDKYIVI